MNVETSPIAPLFPLPGRGVATRRGGFSWPKTIFITGTDTGVGKTQVTGLLANHLQKHGKVLTQKWVQTGVSRPEESDIATHCKIMGAPLDLANFSLQCPYLFKLPASPHLAARLENQVLDPDKLHHAMAQLQSQCDYMLIEGAGGIHVPITEKLLISDLIVKWQLPVVLVVANRVGAINHTLLTLEALKLRQIQVLGVMFNQVGPEDPQVIADTPRLIATKTEVPILGNLPFSRQLDTLKSCLNVLD